MRTRNGMGILAAAAIAVLAGAGDSVAQTPRFGESGDPRACAHGQQLERNVQTAINYYTLAFNAGQPRRAVELYVGVDQNGKKLYTQHNPFAQDGPAAFIAFVEFFKGIFPGLHVRDRAHDRAMRSRHDPRPRHDRSAR